MLPSLSRMPLKSLASVALVLGGVFVPGTAEAREPFVEGQTWGLEVGFGVGWADESTAYTRTLETFGFERYPYGIHVAGAGPPPAFVSPRRSRKSCFHISACSCRPTCSIAASGIAIAALGRTTCLRGAPGRSTLMHGLSSQCESGSVHTRSSGWVRPSAGHGSMFERPPAPTKPTTAKSTSDYNLAGLGGAELTLKHWASMCRAATSTRLRRRTVLETRTKAAEAFCSLG